MAATVDTVDMCICRLPALMASSNNILCDPLSQPVIEHKIFSNEFIWQTFLLYFLRIIYNSSFKMEYVFKSIMQHKGACLFTTDTTGAIHDNILIFFILHHIHGHW